MSEARATSRELRRAHRPPLLGWAHHGAASYSQCSSGRRRRCRARLGSTMPFTLQPGSRGGGTRTPGLRFWRNAVLGSTSGFEATAGQSAGQSGLVLIQTVRVSIRILVARPVAFGGLGKRTALDRVLKGEPAGLLAAVSAGERTRRLFFDVSADGRFSCDLLPPYRSLFAGFLEGVCEPVATIRTNDGMIPGNRRLRPQGGRRTGPPGRWTYGVRFRAVVVAEKEAPPDDCA
jgi:hypothetical protein